MLQFFFWQALLALLYAVLVQLDEKERASVFTGIGWASLAAGLYGALQHFGFDFIAWATGWGDRPGATFGNPNFAAGWWAMSLPLFLARGAQERGGNRWKWPGLAALTALNLYWGRTRGAWIAEVLALFSAFLVWLYLRDARERGPLRSALLPGALLLLLAFSIVAPLRSQFRETRDPSILERVFKWRTAAAMIRDHPLAGVGAGNLKVNFALYQADVRKIMPTPLRATSESNVHNEYLQIAAELGLIGLISFLSLFAVWFWDVLKNPDPAPLGLCASVFAFLYFCLTNFPFHITPNAILLCFVLAAAEPGPDQGEKRTKPVPASPQLRTVALALFVLVFWKRILPPFQADRLRLLAGRAQAQGDAAGAIPLYQEAIALDYDRSERTAYELGECARRTGDLRGALAAYQVSVALRNYGEVYNNIGNCYYLLGQKTSALRNWETAVRLGLPDPAAQKQTEANIETVERQP